MGLLTSKGGSGSGAGGEFQEMKAAITLPVLVIGLTASVGGFLFGADTGQISGFMIMPDYVERFSERHEDGSRSFGTTRTGTLVGMLSIGALVGAMISGPISSWIGRRLGMIIGCAFFFAGTTIQISAVESWIQMTVGRAICGISVGMMSGLVPVYVSETMPKEVRGAMVATYQLFITIGMLISYIINLGCSYADTSVQWRLPLGITYIWAGLLGLGMFLLPESPRWLLAKGREADTYESLRYIAGSKMRDNSAYIDAQFQEISNAILEEKNIKKGTLWESFSPHNKVLYRTCLGFLLQMFQQLTGANYFFYYGATAFESVGISNSYVTQIILGIVNVVCTFPGLWFIDRFGRRAVLIWGGLWQFAWLLIFGSLGGQLDVTKKDVGSGLIVCACMFIAGFASTWGPAIWVVNGEMFPIHVRAYSAAIATSGNWSWNFLLTFFTPMITASIGYRLGYVFAGCNMIGVAIVYFFVCESKSLTLEQLEIMYNDPACKPWTSTKWVPPGHATRYEASLALKGERIVGDTAYSRKDDHQHKENLKV